MAITVERMVAVLEARVDQFEKNLVRSATVADKQLGIVEKRFTAAQSRVESTYKALGQSANAAAFQQQNLRMQLADVGQSLSLGASPLQVLLQQGPQIAQIYGPNEGGIGRAFKETGEMLAGLVTRFAPLLAVLAAAYGAYRLLADNTAAARREVDAATQALAAQAAPVGQIKGIISDLADAQSAYSTAVENTAATQVSASNTIVAATKAEFEAKRQLFELELKRQQASIAVQQAAIAQAGAELRGRLSQQMATINSGVREGTSDPLIGDFTVNQSRLEAIQRTFEEIDADPATDQIKKLRAELTLNEIAAGKMEEALKQAWNGQPIEIEKTTTKVKSSTDAVKQATDAWDGLREVSESVKKAQEASAAQAKIVAERLQAVASTTASAMGDIRRGFLEGGSAAEVFGNAALNVFDKIASAIETQLANALVQALAGTPSGGFNLFGALIGAGTAAAGGGSAGAAALAKSAAPALARAPRAPSASSLRAANQSQKLDVGISVDDDGKITALIRDESGRVLATSEAARREYVRNGLPDDVQRIIKSPRVKGR